MDRGAWRATVHGVAKSCTLLSDFHFYPRVYHHRSSPPGLSHPCPSLASSEHLPSHPPVPRSPRTGLKSFLELRLPMCGPYAALSSLTPSRGPAAPGWPGLGAGSTSPPATLGLCPLPPPAALPQASPSLLPSCQLRGISLPAHHPLIGRRRAQGCVSGPQHR